MAELITSIGEAVKWLLSLFNTFLSQIQETPVLLYTVLFAILATGVGIVFRVLKSFGIRHRGR